MATVSARRRQPRFAFSADGFGPERTSVRIPACAATLEGFRAWAKSDACPDKLRVAFIDNEIYIDMSNEELETHNKVKSEICRVLMNLTRDRQLGHFYLDGVLVTNVEAGVSNNPDAIFIRRDTIRSQRVRFVERKGKQGQFLEIEGTPDWVLEVISDSSVKKDTKKLRQAYHRAGIPEYWLVDARGPEILFQVLVWHAKGYTLSRGKGAWQSSPVFGHSFRLQRQRDDLGLWEYTLADQPNAS